MSRTPPLTAQQNTQSTSREVEKRQCVHIVCVCVCVWGCGSVWICVHAHTCTEQNTRALSRHNRKKKGKDVAAFRRPKPQSGRERGAVSNTERGVQRAMGEGAEVPVSGPSVQTRQQEGRREKRGEQRKAGHTHTLTHRGGDRHYIQGDARADTHTHTQPHAHT